MYLIGAVNDKFLEYHKITLGLDLRENTVQLGNFGSERRSHSWLNQKIRASNHRMIFGPNDPAEYFTGKHSLGEFGIVPNEHSVFFVAGTKISLSKWSECLIKYKQSKPKIVLTHDIPYSISVKMAVNAASTIVHNLDKLLELHRPELWVFESSESFDEVIDGTRFVGLIELQTLKV